MDKSSTVQSVETLGETCTLSIALPPALKPYFWRKGSVAINGVSLTLNHKWTVTAFGRIDSRNLKRTNLGRLKVGDLLNVEVDGLARGLVRQLELTKEMA